MYCTKCGADLRDDAVYCHRCGTRINNDVNKTDSSSKHNTESITRNSTKSSKRAQRTKRDNSPGILLGLLALFISAVVISTSLDKSSDTKTSSSFNSSSSSSYSYSSSSSSGSKSSTQTSTSFTNMYGTPTTVCAHKGCTNYIASSGDTNCCTVHSNKCLECGKYIDEDATWCMSCISKAISSSSSSSKSSSGSSSSKGPWHSSNVKNDGMGPYYCYGKNNTCSNKTYNCYDFYCDSCDPDGDNKEG